MKILAFTDTHSSRTSLEKLLKKAKKEKVNIILCAGDLSVFENGLEAMLKILDRANVPTFVINGNHESEEILAHLVKRHKNLRFCHKKLFRAGDIYIFGFGGGGFSLTDSEFEKTAKKFSKALRNKRFILLTHAPPYNTKVDLVGRSHCGNKSIANFIKLHQPILSVSGHLHETEGRKDKLGKTIIINPGAKGMIIEI